PLTDRSPASVDLSDEELRGPKLRPSGWERDRGLSLAAVRRGFGGLRQVTVVNPKVGAGKTVASLLLGLTFGQSRGGLVLAWANDETRGALGRRAQPAEHDGTVRDLLKNLDRFSGGDGRIGELGASLPSQPDGMFDVLASDDAAPTAEVLT